MQTNKRKQQRAIPRLVKVKTIERPLSQEESEALTICYIASNLNMEAVDGIAKTTFYRQKLKNLGNEFQRELLRTINSAEGVWESEHLDIPELVDYVRKLVQRLAHSPANTVWLVSAFLDAYEENPDATLAALNFKIVEPDQI